MKNLISVVIPCYNVEKYLEKCLESILNQTYRNIEIICIDDGATDKTGKILDEYKQKDNRIRVIHKENGGLSSARNAGLDISNGEYIAFVDSDDYVSEKYIEILLKNLIENDATISVCKNKKFIEGDVVKTQEHGIVSVYESSEKFYQLYTNGAIQECAWGKLYKKELFENLRFPLNRIYEDSSIMHILYFNAEKIVYTEDEYYYYLVCRNDSLMNVKYDLKKQTDNYKAIVERYNFLMEQAPLYKDIIISGTIRNAMPLIERSYLATDIALRNTEFIKNIEKLILENLKLVDKNVLFSILDNYKLACLFLFLQDKEIYAKEIKSLTEKR